MGASKSRHYGHTGEDTQALLESLERGEYALFVAAVHENHRLATKDLRARNGDTGMHVLAGKGSVDGIRAVITACLAAREFERWVQLHLTMNSFCLVECGLPPACTWSSWICQADPCLLCSGPCTSLTPCMSHLHNKARRGFQHHRTASMKVLLLWPSVHDKNTSCRSLLRLPPCCRCCPAHGHIHTAQPPMTLLLPPCTAPPWRTFMHLRP